MNQEPKEHIDVIDDSHEAESVSVKTNRDLGYIATRVDVYPTVGEGFGLQDSSTGESLFVSPVESDVDQQ